MGIHLKMTNFPMETLPLEFTHSYLFSNRYNMPKLHHGDQDYELLVTNGFVKLFTLKGRAYWIAQMEQMYRTSDWKFHISVFRDQIPLAWDIVAKLFMEMQCKSGMKCVFIKDPSNVAKGREITVYIYRYDERYGEGLNYNLKDTKVVFELNKEMDQDGAFWMKFMEICEERLKKAGVKKQGCAKGDLKLGEYFSLRNESFVLHEKITEKGEKIRDFEYPWDSDGWNSPNQKLPFKLPMKVWMREKKTNFVFFSVVISVFIYFLMTRRIY